MAAFDSGSSGKLKAAIVNAYIDVLNESGRMDLVAPRLSPEARALVAAKLARTAWVNLEHIGALFDAIGAVGGANEVRRVTKLGSQRATFRAVRPIIDGVRRIFGLTPKAFVKHFKVGLAAVSKGVHAQCEVRDEDATVRIFTEGFADTVYTAESWAAALEATIELTSFEGNVHVIAREAKPNGGALTLAARWRSRP